MTYEYYGHHQSKSGNWFLYEGGIGHKKVKHTALIMPEYGFSLTRIFSYQDGIFDFPILENTDQRKSVFWPQPTITCSKLTIETLEEGVKYVQS